MNAIYQQLTFHSKSFETMTICGLFIFSEKLNESIHTFDVINKIEKNI